MERSGTTGRTCRRRPRGGGTHIEGHKISSIVSKKRSITAATRTSVRTRLFAIMILKLLVPLAAVSVAYAIPASLRGARTGRALTEETLKNDETPKDDETPKAAAGPEGAAIAGMDPATQRDLVDGILRDPSTARDVIASALGLEPSVADRLLGAKEVSPCAGLLALCDKHELTGIFCDFASDCGGIKAISEFFDQAEEASRDDTETPETDDDAPPFVNLDVGFNIPLPGGASIGAGVNLEVVGEGSGPGLSIGGGVGAEAYAYVDPTQNPLEFGVGVGVAAGAIGETGVDGGLDMGGVDLEFETFGESGAGIGAAARLGDSYTFGVSGTELQGNANFQAAANPMGADVDTSAGGDAVVGTGGLTVDNGDLVALGGVGVGAGGFVGSNSGFAVGPTVSAGNNVFATGGVGVEVLATGMGESQELSAGVGGEVESVIMGAVSPTGASAAGDLDVGVALNLDANGDLITGSTVITVPIVDVGFEVGIP